VVGGWSVSGIATFQEGYPLALTATGTASAPGWGKRPNIVPGCNPVVTGSAQSRLHNWFNTSCFTVPGAYAIGDASSTDPKLRGPGINNFDFPCRRRRPSRNGST
jgi:hypothetical protein